ncbi:MAG: hypothetical protein R2750_03755 [Bacteroidales bacterium]
MAQAKKFGAFGGVFTPSLLTILGVIMYMRLGWVVGAAGLINTIIIIFLAHVISISTGLSVSSIATDKKIKAGGIYYILSRSLGLPMGGAIGITLFVGTALSISLYLVGFAENFLSIEPIRDFLGLEQNKFGYQVVGTAAIFILVIIAFISTSMAIKAQYYILSAIALSLITIGAGFFFNTGFYPESVILYPNPEGIPLELVFAVFFPAVTGFTAGVAMSGDLKDPKKAIPRGTMSAIITGFIIYVGLAVGIAFFVDRDILLNDINFLMKVAWFSPLVIAGIWGATLSSALGGILGGPRILQAMSSDRIGPKIFSKVYGVNNEPRNALILIFLIAEAGILIGELNVIARVVSMFYLASYGFINIAYYLESWASTDFRPTFRINRYIGLIGFIAAFGVMFKLDILSMLTALIIMISIYFFLKRKQIKLDFGDVWQSVWSSLIRTALDKMDKAEEVERNWQPNIILFSGGTKKRPHLISLGKCLVGRHGVLSNFDLIENKHAKALFPKKNQSIPGEDPAKGVFTRRQTVKDIYDGIDMISRTYGFSGLEPNTVMLGWARQSRNPARFVKLLKTLSELDLNVLMLGYDQRVGFGKKETIDIWFRDKSNHGNLALTLSKLIVLSDEWHKAKIRVLVVNYLNERSEIIYKKMEDILDHMRIDAQIKVINNQIERKPFYTIVEEESDTTDLVFLEIPKIKKDEETTFVENTNILLERIGTVMLLEASSSFKKQKIGLEDQKPSSANQALENKADRIDLPKLNYPHKPELAEELKHLTTNLEKFISEYVKKVYNPLLATRYEKIEQMQQAIDKAFDIFSEKIENMQRAERIQLVSQLKTGLLVKLSKIIEEQLKAIPDESEEIIERGTFSTLKNLNTIVFDIPERVSISLYLQDVLPASGEPFSAKSFKKRTSFFKNRILKKEGVPYKVDFNKLCSPEILQEELEKIKTTFSEFVNYNIAHIFEWQKLSYAVSDALLYVEKNISSTSIQKTLHKSKQNIDTHIDRLQQLHRNITKDLPGKLTVRTYEIINNLCEQVSKVPANTYITKPSKKNIRTITVTIQEQPKKWAVNHRILLKSIHADSQLLLAEYRLFKVIQESLREMGNVIEHTIVAPISSYTIKGKGSIKQTAMNKPKQPQELNLSSHNLQLNLNKIIDKAFRNIKSTLQHLPQSLDIFTEETINEITNKQFDEAETIKIPVFRLADYMVQNELIAPLISSTNIMVRNIHQSVSKIEDAIRLVNLSAQHNVNLADGEGFEKEEDIQHFKDGLIKKINLNIDSIREEFETYRKSILSRQSHTGNELHLFRLSKSAEKNYSSGRFEAEKKVRYFQKKMNQLEGNFQTFRAAIWHSQSEARLFAKKITDMENAGSSVIDKLLTLKEYVSASPSNLEKLPFYYQQLFLNKYNFQTEFWHGRKAEVAAARKAINRYKAGQKGVLMVTGDRQSGKTFFWNYIVSRYLADHPLFFISPFGAGSVDINQFVNSLKEATGKNGTKEEILNSLPESSVLIFDDIELWWQKSANGSRIVDELFQLIKNYNDKILFILIFNKAAFNVLGKLQPFEHFALRTIELQAFKSKELQEIILFRHRISGFNLQVDSILPTTLTQARQARLFNKIFKFSDGNIGAALLCWIANIRDVKNDTVHIESPRKPDIDIFGGLAKEIKVYLMQFILHKRLTVKKLTEILMEEEEKTRYILNYLKRAGLLTELAGEVYEIDQYMYIHIQKYLLEKFDTV